MAANSAVIAAYATRDARTEIPFWTLLFNNVSYPLEAIAKAHDRVDAGGRGRVLITIPR